MSIGIAITQFPFHFLESLTSDARFRVLPSSDTSGKVSLITFDKKSMEVLGRPPNAHEHQLVLEKVIRVGVKAIVYVPSATTFPFVTSSQGLQGTALEKNKLAMTMRSFENTYVIYDNLLVSDQSSVSLPSPFEQIKYLPGPLSRDLKNFAADGVARRGLVADRGQLLVQPQVASLINGITEAKDYRGTFEFRGSLQVYVDYKPTGTYPQESFMNILRGHEPWHLKDQIVLIGFAPETDTDDYVQTPYSRDALSMSVVEAHANIIDTFIMNAGIRHTPPWIDAIITYVISLLIAFVVFTLKPILGVLILVATLLGFTALGLFLFGIFDISIGMAHPILCTFISYYLFIPYRLIKEYRKRWEYQQKNKLLTEVEELKTNFLSMMSHDLKTPLARIQGMAELALRNSGSLTQAQKDALLTIEQSSDELSIFISSILNLGRIESKEIKLNLHSKDVNALADEVVEKYRYLATAKNIEIVTEYEPIFSIKIDVDLIRQVFGNLIENAIKYSPEKSRILVSTEEKDNHVVIQVADQGIGIPGDEIEHVFMKFYRSRLAKQSPVKGSGLGLYLAKYFVELHRGRISVESVHQAGSTFSVVLPMQQ